MCCVDFWRASRRSPARWWRWQWRRAAGTGGSGGSTSACPSHRAGSRRPRSGRSACTGPAPSRPGGSPSAACAGHWRWPVGSCWSACCSSERRERRESQVGSQATSKLECEWQCLLTERRIGNKILLFVQVGNRRAYKHIHKFLIESQSTVKKNNYINAKRCMLKSTMFYFNMS